MKPILKWTGGKRREIPEICGCLPASKIKTYVEPFCGGAALFWHLHKTGSVINDFDKDLINFYQCIQNDYVGLKERTDALSKMNGNHDAMEKVYYDFRDGDKSKLSDVERAVQFCYVNQLAFSGMRRFNSDGKFNVPFGHYKSFNLTITPSHVALLEATSIRNEDALNVIGEYDYEGAFIFLDPPYTRVFNKYSADNVFGEKEQHKLFEVFSALKHAKCMIVIDKSDFTQKMYADYVYKTYDLSYGVNIKNRFSTSVQHLVIVNYKKELEDIYLYNEKQEDIFYPSACLMRKRVKGICSLI